MTLIPLEMENATAAELSLILEACCLPQLYGNEEMDAGENTGICDLNSSEYL